MDDEMRPLRVGYRHPLRAPVPLTQSLTELTGPLLGEGRVGPLDDGRPVPSTLVEVWQCNSAGRYRHAGDRHPARIYFGDEAVFFKI
jgi:protocatechuate 3,4-dioxygenase beta subunit